MIMITFSFDFDLLDFLLIDMSVRVKSTAVIFPGTE